MPLAEASATRCAAVDTAGAWRRVRSPERRELPDRIAGRRGDRLRTRNVELGRDLRHRLRHDLRRRGASCGGAPARAAPALAHARAGPEGARNSLPPLPSPRPRRPAATGAPSAPPTYPPPSSSTPPTL